MNKKNDRKFSLEDVEATIKNADKAMARADEIKDKLLQQILDNEHEKTICLFFMVNTLCIGGNGGNISKEKMTIFRTLFDSLLSSDDEESRAGAIQYVQTLFDEYKDKANLSLLSERIKIARNYSDEVRALIVRSCEMVAGKVNEEDENNIRESENEFIKLLRNELTCTTKNYPKALAPFNISDYEKNNPGEKIDDKIRAALKDNSMKIVLNNVFLGEHFFFQENADQANKLIYLDLKPFLPTHEEIKNKKRLSLLGCGIFVLISFFMIAGDSPIFGTLGFGFFGYASYFIMFQFGIEAQSIKEGIIQKQPEWKKQFENETALVNDLKISA